MQNLEDAARDALRTLDRLIGVGIDTQRDGLTLVGRPRDFLAQPLRRIGLGVQFRFEIESRRQIEIRMRRPREAVDTATLYTSSSLFTSKAPVPTLGSGRFRSF